MKREKITYCAQRLEPLNQPWRGEAVITQCGTDNQVIVRGVGQRPVAKALNVPLRKRGVWVVTLVDPNRPYDPQPTICGYYDNYRGIWL